MLKAFKYGLSFLFLLLFFIFGMTFFVMDNPDISIEKIATIAGSINKTESTGTTDKNLQPTTNTYLYSIAFFILFPFTIIFYKKIFLIYGKKHKENNSD